MFRDANAAPEKHGFNVRDMHCYVVRMEYAPLTQQRNRCMLYLFWSLGGGVDIYLNTYFVFRKKSLGSGKVARRSRCYRLFFWRACDFLIGFLGDVGTGKMEEGRNWVYCERFFVLKLRVGAFGAVWPLALWYCGVQAWWGSEKCWQLFCASLGIEAWILKVSSKNHRHEKSAWNRYASTNAMFDFINFLVWGIEQGDLALQPLPVSIIIPMGFCSFLIGLPGYAESEYVWHIEKHTTEIESRNF